MNCIVTGGAGFIGSHLTEQLLKDGHAVTVIDSSKENIEKNLTTHKGLKVVCEDINSPSIAKEFKGCDFVFHLAALADIVPSIEDPESYHKSNVTGTLCVLEHSRKNRVKKFVYAASGSCYGDAPSVPTAEYEKLNPCYPYAVTKMLGERYALSWSKIYGLPVVSLRLFNVYGPRSRTTGAYGAVFGVFLAQKLAGKPFTVVGDGYQSRDFLFVTDAVDAFIRASASEFTNEVFNVGSGQHVSIRSLIGLLGDQQIDYVPKRPGEPQITLANINKIQMKLGWNPKLALPDGVKILLEKIEYWRSAPVWDKKSIEKATESWFNHLGGNNNVHRLQ